MRARIREVNLPILLLVEIKRRGGARPKDLEEALGVHTSTLYSNLKDLMLLGYIEKRNGRYIVTEKGMEYLNRIKMLYREIADSI